MGCDCAQQHGRVVPDHHTECEASQRRIIGCPRLHLHVSEVLAGACTPSRLSRGCTQHGFPLFMWMHPICWHSSLLQWLSLSVLPVCWRCLAAGQPGALQALISSTTTAEGASAANSWNSVSADALDMSASWCTMLASCRYTTGSSALPAACCQISPYQPA